MVGGAIVKNKKTIHEKYQIAGWHEWVGLPELGIDCIKAKLDTGARTSAIHAEEIKYVEENGQTMVHFLLLLDSTEQPIQCAAPLFQRKRKVKSSSGDVTMRPVVETFLELGGKRYRIELTLADRSVMNFQILIGRTALRGRFLVNSGRSYLLSSRQNRDLKTDG